MIYKYRQIILLSCIFFIAIFLRFYNYTNRWDLASDQARDILIVREALVHHALPLIGPFSASGPFVFGPYWYWVFMIPISIFNSSLLAPWIFQTILYSLAVILMFIIGKKLINSSFGYLLAFLTAISPSEITVSSNLIFSALVGLIAFVILYCFTEHIRKKQLPSLIFLSFLISIAINTHFEAIPLVVLIPISFIYGQRKISHALAAFVSFLIPFLPLIIFDFHSRFYESSHIFHFHNSSSIQPSPLSLVKQWVNFLGIFYPSVWGHTFGGLSIFGYLFILGLGIVLINPKLRKQIPHHIKIITLSFILVLFFLCFYGGEVYETFLAFTFPFILLISTWLCYLVFRYNRYLGTGILIILTALNLFVNMQTILTASNSTADIANFWKKELTKQKPTKKYSVYMYTESNKNESLSLSLFLDYAGKIDEHNGSKIGVASFGAPIGHTVLIDAPVGLRIYDLGQTSNRELLHEGFIPVNPNDVYQSVEGWYKK